MDYLDQLKEADKQLNKLKDNLGIRDDSPLGDAFSLALQFIDENVKHIEFVRQF